MSHFCEVTIASTPTETLDRCPVVMSSYRREKAPDPDRLSLSRGDDGHGDVHVFLVPTHCASCQEEAQQYIEEWVLQGFELADRQALMLPGKCRLSFIAEESKTVVDFEFRLKTVLGLKSVDFMVSIDNQGQQPCVATHVLLGDEPKPAVHLLPSTLAIMPEEQWAAGGQPSTERMPRWFQSLEREMWQLQQSPSVLCGPTATDFKGVVEGNMPELLIVAHGLDGGTLINDMDMLIQVLEDRHVGGLQNPKCIVLASGLEDTAKQLMEKAGVQFVIYWDSSPKGGGPPDSIASTFLRLYVEELVEVTERGQSGFIKYFATFVAARARLPDAIRSLPNNGPLRAWGRRCRCCPADSQIQAAGSDVAAIMY